MKGKLIIKETRWFIIYNNFYFLSLPLHPLDVKFCNDYGDYSIDWINKEVEFEIVTELNNNKIQTYAKLK